MQREYRRLTLACYTTNVSMSVVGNLAPLLFLTFRGQYGISYSLLGMLSLTNFMTQLLVDLIFTFFSHRFSLPRIIRSTPLITFTGLTVFALWPMFFPQNAYIGLLIGTVIFSAAAGLNEVLSSPLIAAIPSDDPDREMSKLHSVYAWGVVGVVVISTLFLRGFGAQNWQWLVLLFLLIPLTSFLLFQGTKMPNLESPGKISGGVVAMLKNRTLWLGTAIIFLGGASECVMAQWSSGYLENALGIPKVWGDIFGVAMFSVMLGMGRTLYSKYGKKIDLVLLCGVIGAAGCYLLAAVSPIPLVGLIACAVTGFCASMLWPGSLIAISDRVPNGGVLMYALMAAGGDCGAAIGSQLVGVISDLAPEQIGMKLGMLVGMLFPLIAIPLLIVLIKKHPRPEK